MNLSKTSVAAFLSLALFTALSTGCEERPDRDPVDDAYDEGFSRGLDEETIDYERSRLVKDGPNQWLGDCKTSHEFRIVLDEIESAFQELKLNRRKSTYTQEDAKNRLAGAELNARTKAHPKFLRDLLVHECFNYGPGVSELSGTNLLKANDCMDSADEAAPAFRHEPDQKPYNRLKGKAAKDEAQARLKGHYLYSVLNYATKSIQQIRDRNVTNPVLFPMAKDTLSYLEVIQRVREEAAINAKTAKIDLGLHAIKKLKKSAGAVYLSLSCDAKEAFTFLGGSGRVAPGRGSDLDSKSPVGPTEIPSARDHNAPPVQVGI